MAAKKKLQVFVSSTFADLIAERQAAVEAILKSGHIPAGMELFAAGDESQMETIRRWIDESDAYMLILGARYGSIEPKTSLSYTELEYDCAVSQDIPVFAVVITENAIDKKVADQGREVLEAEHPQELKLFREKALSRTSSFFDDPKDIKLAVHETLADFLVRFEFRGWVSGSELPNANALLNDITRLNKRNAELERQVRDFEKKLDRANKRSKGEWSDDDFADLITILEPIEISTKAFNDDEEDDPRRFPLLRFLVVFRDRMVTGVSNRAGSTDLDRLLFFNLFPKLEVHGLAAPERIAGVAWRRKCLTPKGLALLAYIDKNKLFQVDDGKGKAKKKPTTTRNAKRKTKKA